ncbi:hypothetical protein CROQUDRAFT_132717 [Cronartium quercuum f. sp. fusiforme G11]|uniref:Uncharacterized protein n=1 Tax=Cronartium quercuum f. sp. fusiforme G11 TaxID=708437 RepID=A0A9P6NPC3_9BASI|nr:hypothetical protein CROQUDRAFT_132717 [Cronartium quercuum f. sp. fusiforme G11]
MVHWSLAMEEKLGSLLTLSNMVWMNGCPNGIQPLQLVFQGSFIFTSWETWKKSQEVLKAVHTKLCWAHTYMWMVWHSDVSSLLSRTSGYLSESLEETSNLHVAWKDSKITKYNFQNL